MWRERLAALTVGLRDTAMAAHVCLTVSSVHVTAFFNAVMDCLML